MIRKLCFFIIALAALLALTSCAREEPPVEPPDPALRVNNGQLVDGQDNPVVLRGMSSHGLGWYPRYINGAAM